VQEVEGRRPEWRRHRKVSLRIPLAPVLADSRERVASDVRQWHTARKVDRQIVGAIAPAIGLSPEGRSTSIPAAELLPPKEVFKSLQSAGLVEVSADESATTVTGYTPRQRELYERLKAVGTLLQAYRDDDAEKHLAEITIEPADPPGFAASTTTDRGSWLFTRRISQRLLKNSSGLAHCGRPSRKTSSTTSSSCSDCIAPIPPATCFPRTLPTFFCSTPRLSPQFAYARTGLRSQEESPRRRCISEILTWLHAIQPRQF